MVNERFMVLTLKWLQGFQYIPPTGHPNPCRIRTSTTTITITAATAHIRLTSTVVGICMLRDMAMDMAAITMDVTPADVGFSLRC
jgi:hypothetical protein